MFDDDQRTSRTGRRNFLRATGVTLSGAAFASAASARGEAQSDVHVVTKQYGDGIGLDHVEEVRKKAVAEFNARGGDLEAPPARSTPDPEEGTIVSYAYQIDRNGVPHQYTGIAGDSNSVGRLHTRASGRAEAFERGEVVETDDATTKSGSWDRILHDEADFCKEPYGCVTNNFNLNELQNEGDALQDAFGIKHVFVMEPGIQKYGSSWVNSIGQPMHDWRQNDMGGEDLHGWDPLGTNDGSQSISVSIGTSGASLGWQYTQPAVTTIDESSPSGNYAKWSEEFNMQDARENTNGMKPGSSTWIDEQPTGSGYYSLMDLVSDGEFYDSTWYSSSTHSLKHTFHIDVYY